MRAKSRSYLRLICYVAASQRSGTENLSGEFILLEDHLRIAEDILRRAGFATSWLALSGSSRVLVGEDDYFVLGVVAAATLKGLLAAEEVISIAFVNRLAEAAAGPKQWDAYLVLMTPEAPSKSREGASELVALNYDTRYLRRLAHVGVQPARESIEQALRPFLPLPLGGDLESAVDPLKLLQDELPHFGISPKQAAQAISSYRLTGAIEDA